MVEFGNKLDEKMKAMLSEIKENIQRTNSDGKETGTHVNGSDEKETFNQNRMKKQEFKKKKMKRGLGTSGTTLNVPTTES